ncbi:MAG: glycosyl transferase family 14, partial [Chloroflexi bacterium]
MINIVYLLIIYKNLEQVIRLVDRLNGANVQFLIHVDKKVPNDYFTGAQRAFQSYENCTFI